MANYDKRPRPSKLPHLDACPRFESAPDDRISTTLSDAADEGTLIHAKMEELAAIPETEWDDAIGKMKIEPLQADLVRACAAQVRDLFQLGLPTYGKEYPKEHYRIPDADIWPEDANGKRIGVSGIFAEVSVDAKITQPGTADLLVVYGNRAVLVDYKIVRVVRQHEPQLMTYAIAAFDELPQVEFVEVRIVTPRLGEVHAPVTYSRADDLPRITAEIQRIVDDSLDPFNPGRPCDSCCMCAGNGRCPWQMASLRDIPTDMAAVLVPGVWSTTLTAATPDMRGMRRSLVKWLEAFTDAVKEDDKQWARENPDTMLPGFTKSVGLGRPSLDRDRLGEANMTLCNTFGIRPEELLGFAVPDKARLAEHISMFSGQTQKEAEVDIGKALTPFTKRGEDIISFRAEKRKKAIE